MRSDRAICVGVDRPSQKILCQFPSAEGIAPTIVPLPYLGTPPWPLSFVHLLEVASGSFMAMGGIGDDEIRLREDFDEVEDIAPGFVAGSTWEWAGTTPYVITARPEGYGTLRLGTGTSANNSIGGRKDPITLTPPPAFWLESKLSIVTASSRNVKVGLVDASSDPFNTTNELTLVSQSSTSGGSLYLRARSGGLTTEVDTGFVPTAGVPFYVDIVASGGAFASAWIKSDPLVEDEFTVRGPFTVESNVPTNTVGPGFGVQTTTSSTAELDIDHMTVHTVWPIASPADLVSAVV